MHPVIIILIILAATSTSLSMNAAATSLSRIAVVTGANKGIGFHIAEQLAISRQFTDVILGCRDRQRGESAVRDIASKLELESSPCTVSYQQLTIGDKASHDAFRSAIESRYGKLDG
jgi:NAD(P)-dependent dehydrogenase (short-subunit alcohol dehydrogenase family)